MTSFLILNPKHLRRGTLPCVEFGFVSQSAWLVHLRQRLRRTRGVTEGQDAAVLLTQGAVTEPSNGGRSWWPTDRIINGCHGFTVQTWIGCKLRAERYSHEKWSCPPLSIIKTELFSFKTVSYLCCFQPALSFQRRGDLRNLLLALRSQLCWTWERLSSLYSSFSLQVAKFPEYFKRGPPFSKGSSTSCVLFSSVAFLISMESKTFLETTGKYWHIGDFLKPLISGPLCL